LNRKLTGIGLKSNIAKFDGICKEDFPIFIVVKGDKKGRYLDDEEHFTLIKQKSPQLRAFCLSN